MREQFLWIEKYRPSVIEDCVLPDSIKQTFIDIRDSGKIPNLILAGNAGTGKTTVARALCNETATDMYMVNSSETGNIDMLRTDIRNFASTVSLEGNRKVVLLDEADYLNPNSTQPALRAFMEEFALNTSFIMTCNFKNKIITPLHSRCMVIDFKIPKKDRPTIAKDFLKRILYILDTEKVEYEKKVVAELINKHFPDFRRTINELQRYSQKGKIDTGILAQIADVKIVDLIKSLRDKDFKNMRQWVVENADQDSVRVFRLLYDSMYDHFSPESIPQLVLILGDYLYKSAFVADPEINMVACMTQIMVDCEFKK